MSATIHPRVDLHLDAELSWVAIAAEIGTEYARGLHASEGRTNIRKSVFVMRENPQGAKRKFAVWGSPQRVTVRQFWE